jgi:hypothetical protein
MGCDCAGICPKSAHCIAIYIYDTGECWVACSKDRIKLPADERVRVPLDQKIDVDMRGTDLARLGAFLAERSDVDLLIPAARATDWVEVKEKGITLRELIDRVGLVVANPTAKAG